MHAISSFLFPSFYRQQFRRDPIPDITSACKEADKLFALCENKLKQTSPHIAPAILSIISLYNRSIHALHSPALGSRAAVYSYLTPETILFDPVAFLTAVIVVPLLRAYTQPTCFIIGNYRKELDKIKEETKELSSFTLTNLLDALVSNTTDQQKMFLQPLIDARCAQIRTGNLQKRFIYEVKWGNTVTGYLIGTCHRTNAEVASDPVLHDLTAKCKSVWAETSYENVRVCEALTFYRHFFSPTRYVLDASLLRTAKQKHIPIHPLDTANEHLATDVAVEALLKQYRGSTFQIPTDAARYAQHPKKHRYLECLELYQKGDAKMLWDFNRSATPSEVDDELLTKRNNNWLQLLVPLLKERPSESFRTSFGLSVPDSLLRPFSPQPVGIISGAAHLFGSNGLIWQLRHKNFTVTRLSTS